MAWFDWTSRTSSASQELPDIFPIPIKQTDFINIDVQNIFQRILTDVFERTHGIPEERQKLLWDNCLGSETQDGLITMVAKAMAKKGELYLIFNPALNVIVKATPEQETQIRNDYKARGESDVGIYITFRNYVKSDMVKFYSLLEYCAIGGLWKQGNIAKAIQLKMTDLRGSVSLTDKSDVETQAMNLASGLASGRDVLLDAEDMIELAKPDMTATTSMMIFIAQKHSFYLGLPASYFTGEIKTGISDTGKSDAKAIERGLKAYYFQLVKPIIDEIFDITTSFKSDDSEELSTALEALKTMDLTSDRYLSRENKTLVVNKSFGLDESQQGDESDDTPVVL